MVVVFAACKCSPWHPPFTSRMGRRHAISDIKKGIVKVFFVVFSHSDEFKRIRLILLILLVLY